ncbi:MAG: CDP-diacylglycerol--glycerol-3-phosphate 3-phosphatidyltransferase [Bdellovibrionales bacterium]|nr:CDP-diacylglycerol--glycerol-3-phosphate 3-phosphatidyltransferase [Bdellovibrionales bacterium]
MTDQPRTPAEIEEDHEAERHEDQQEALAQRELEFNNLPNRLTALRMLMVPAVVGLMFLQNATWDFIAALLFVVASITDYFDGYYARTRQVVTIYGKLMDPLADKFLVVSALIMLSHFDRIHPVLVILLICRELAITGLRALASAEGVIIAASDSAKWKTATQMTAIPLLMVKDGLFGIPVFPLGVGLIYLSLAVSLWSAKSYVVGFFRGLAERRRVMAEDRRRKREERRAIRLARKGKAPA